MKAAKFAPRGLLALAPQAYGLEFPTVDADEPGLDLREAVAVISVRGPLNHHAGWLFDSYEGILARAQAAFDAKPQAVILSVDSPGGLVSGCFDASRALRRMATRSGIPLVAHINEQATSAAYAIACAATRIFLPPSALVGSIGVIDTLVDATAEATMHGLSIRLVASGRRKTDGNPYAPISGDAEAASQKAVDELAELFFELVAEHREISVDDVRALDAGLVHGAEAVARGLADEVASFDDVIARFEGGQSMATSAETEDENQAQAEEEEQEQEEQEAAVEETARRALQAIVDDDEADDSAKARARAALAALEEEGDDSDTSASSEEDDKEASAPAGLEALAAEVHQMKAERRAEKRAALFQKYPHVDASLKKQLAGLPLARVKAVLDAVPRPKMPNLAAASTPGATRGEGQGTARTPIRPELEAQMNRVMGIGGGKRGVFRRDGKIIIGAEAPEKEGA